MQIKFEQYQPKSNSLALAKGFAKGFFMVVCLIGILLWGFYSTHAYYNIYGASMEPTVGASGYSCYITPQETYERGDIVISFDQTKHDSPVIKRIIATEGDLVGFYLNTTPELQGFEHEFYQVLVIKNGTEPILLNETYLYAGILDTEEQNQKLINNQVTYNQFLSSPEVSINLMQVFFRGQAVNLLPIPKGEVFILGDNRLVSKDSSHYGTVALSSIQGKVEYIFETSTPSIFIALKQIFGF